MAAPPWLCSIWLRSIGNQCLLMLLLGGLVGLLWPASVSGLKAVIRQELQSRGLPLDFLQLIYINGEWLYRFETVLAFEGLVVLAVIDGMPWAYRNRRGELVGFDIALVKALARSLGVTIDVRETALTGLESWLAAEWIDLALGGSSPVRSGRCAIS